VSRTCPVDVNRLSSKKVFTDLQKSGVDLTWFRCAYRRSAKG